MSNEAFSEALSYAHHVLRKSGYVEMAKELEAPWHVNPLRDFRRVEGIYQELQNTHVAVSLTKLLALCLHDLKFEWCDLTRNKIIKFDGAYFEAKNLVISSYAGLTPAGLTDPDDFYLRNLMIDVLKARDTSGMNYLANECMLLANRRLYMFSRYHTFAGMVNALANALDPIYC